MTAVVQRSYGDPSCLSVATVARPTPGVDDVLIEVRAAAISPGDRAMITGVPYVNRLAASGVLRPKHPIPGFDVAGTVVAAGHAVTDLARGDAVFGSADGSLAEYAVAPRARLARIPEAWSFARAAAVPESGHVAVQAVREQGRVEPGQEVAVIGAGGGVGAYAVQVAAADGARVTGVCGADAAGAVRSLGAAEVVDYRTARLTDTGRRFDVIIDTAGTDPLRALRRALTPRGALVIVGTDHRHRVTGGLGRWVRALGWSPFVGQRLRPFVARPLDADGLDALVELMATGQLQACIDRTFPLGEVAAAMAHLDHRGSPGKVVVTVEPRRGPTGPPVA